MGRGTTFENGTVTAGVPLSIHSTATTSYSERRRRMFDQKPVEAVEARLGEAFAVDGTDSGSYEARDSNSEARARVFIPARTFQIILRLRGWRDPWGAYDTRIRTPPASSYANVSRR